MSISQRKADMRVLIIHLEADRTKLRKLCKKAEIALTRCFKQLQDQQAMPDSVYDDYYANVIEELRAIND